MTWNWQLKKWPQFIYNEEDFKEQELQFFEKAGMLYGSFQHIDADEQEALKIDLISQEAVKTSEIEGEVLNRDSIHSSIRRQFGLQTDHRRIEPAEQGIAEMMVDLYRNYEAPLTKETLCSWHEMLTNGRRDLIDIGRYRTHEDPMQIVSGHMGRPVIHFEAPPSKRVSQEMESFLTWFNHSIKSGKNELPVLVRAAIAHLHFECIHPFEDGNGRIGRAISEKSLSQSIGRPTLIALSNTINEHKKSYYEALESNNKDLDISDWISYFSDAVLNAQDETQKTIAFIIEKGKFYKRFEKLLNARQSKVVERVFREGFKGFKGGLSAKNYQKISGAPSATATRDLAKMVEIGAFTRTGELKSTRYHLNIKK
ncbi:Fic family protein [uncultured Roseivirga sp.]|uniref:Fic family protein n=1 Tax=uncultured Roseivirga sp. TaxID=543088 RepID=UPI0030D80852|tara:strand:+ start:1313 stop:2419 length:1107 start_codon:yes stop_codon:yes gene_type:complete